MNIKVIGVLLVAIYVPLSFAEDCPNGETSETLEVMDNALQNITDPVDTPKLNSIVAGASSVSQARKFIQLQMAVCRQEEAKEKAATSTKLLGLNWGMGLAHMNLKGESITDAAVIDNVVRVKKANRTNTSIMLESHYLLPTEKSGGRIGYGPFVAMRLADLDTKELNVSAFGVGMMAGFRAKSGDAFEWNIGFGYFVDIASKALGSGVVEGQALSGTEKEIRYKEFDRTGWGVVVSAGY